MSEVGPKAPSFMPTCVPEQILMPKPTHTLYQTHRDEPEDKLFKTRSATILAKMDSKAMVMENGI